MVSSLPLLDKDKNSSVCHSQDRKTDNSTSYVGEQEEEEEEDKDEQEVKEERGGEEGEEDKDE